MKKILDNIKNSFGWGLAARNNFTIRADDVFLVSYPKSGNTWLRNLVGQLEYAEYLDGIHALDIYIPDIYKTRSYKLDGMVGQRYLKSHEYFDHRYNNVIVVIRDPRDVCVSYYYYLKKTFAIPDTLALEDFVAIFIKGEADNFASWAEHVGSWSSVNNESKRSLFIKYEDIRQKPEELILRVANFLSIEVNSERIANIAKNISFDVMKRAEQDGAHKWKEVSKTRQDIMFMREGVSGGWRESMSQESSGQIERAFEKEMLEHGYL